MLTVLQTLRVDTVNDLLHMVSSGVPEKYCDRHYNPPPVYNIQYNVGGHGERPAHGGLRGAREERGPSRLHHSRHGTRRSGKDSVALPLFFIVLMYIR